VAFTEERLTLWIISGIIGAVVREFFDLILMWIGISKFHIVFLSVDLFTNDPKQIKSFLGLFTGTLTDWIMSAVIAVIIGIVLQWSGRKNYLLKGIGIGFISWVVIMGFLVHGVPKMFVTAPKDLPTILYSLMAHIIFGGMTAFLINKFTRIPNN
jgi:hypothetical protein